MLTVKVGDGETSVHEILAKELSFTDSFHRGVSRGEGFVANGVVVGVAKPIRVPSTND